MTIRKGEPWGEAIVCPAGLAMATDDRTVACFEGEIIGLSGGDLWQVVGRPPRRVPGEACTAARVDRLSVTVSRRNGESTCRAVSHVRVGHWLARGRLVVVTNLGQMGRWNLAPRAHPNDGLLHMVTVDGAMGYRERMIARRRAETGQHVPHPFISIASLAETSIERRGRESLFIDGLRVRGWNSVRVRVRSDDLTVVI